MIVRSALIRAGFCLALGGIAQAATYTFPAYFDDRNGQPYIVDVTASGEKPGQRIFDLHSSAPQRDNGPTQRIVRESAEEPAVDSGSVLFDALFAQAIDDGRLASVESIRDYAYNGNAPIPCHCFETGEKWPFVWTRDLSYALDLGLAGFDPARGANGLLFKTSGFRPGIALPAGVSPPQIIQDTGSGGSWPVSTDRVAWALGAQAVLDVLPGSSKADFTGKVYAALKGTLEADRLAAFDPRDGLYTGEHSFLDWREQTYPAWVVSHLSALAQSKALSTNVLEYRALMLAADLARSSGDTATAARYRSWAGALVKAIRTKFWMPRAGLFATYTTADWHARPVEKYDLLGNSLAILSGVASDAQGRTILSRYPFAPFGPPVVWPEAQDVAVYHNRADWPFVTAYAMKAAAKVRHVAAFDAGLASLMRAFALNLSDMENLEWLTGLPQYDGGPVVDSRRQLWSIAAWYGTVTGSVFGWNPQQSDVVMAPFLTARTRRLFGSAHQARLSGLKLGDATVDITLNLPNAIAEDAYYPVRAIRLNGARVSARFAKSALKPGTNRIEIDFAPAKRSGEHLTMVPQVASLSHSDPRVFMPQTPAIASLDTSAGLRISVQPPADPTLRYEIFRDGQLIAQGQSGPVLSAPSPKDRDTTACYSVVAVRTQTGLASQPSLPVCRRGRLAQDIAIADPRIRTDAPKLDPSDGVAEPTLQLGLGNRLAIADVTIAKPGVYAVSALYDNHAFFENTGVTNAVKLLTVTDAAGRRQQAVMQMPHIPVEGTTHPLRLSTRAYFRLQPGRYRLDWSDFFNMSELEGNASYNNPGGKSGPVNQARIAKFEIDAVETGR